MATIRTTDASTEIEGLLAEAIERELVADAATTDGADVGDTPERRNAPAIDCVDTGGGAAAARRPLPSMPR